MALTDKIVLLAQLKTNIAQTKSWVTTFVNKLLEGFVKSEDYATDKATFETKENASKTYQPIGDYATNEALSSAIEQAKEDIVGEDLKDSLDTLESIKSWKEQHGTEYTNLLAEVQKKANASDVYTKAQTDEKIAEVVAGSVDLTPYLKSADAAETYQKISDMSNYYTKEQAGSTFVKEADWATKTADFLTEEDLPVAKIENGTITLGTNSIKPLVEADLQFATDGDITAAWAD